jgi:hypothetical protein
MKPYVILLTTTLAVFVSPADASKETHYFNCQAGSISARMVMHVERIASHGITYGPGVNPDITGVIPDGGKTIYTQGTVTSTQGNFTFSGENQFAEFYNTTYGGRHLVEWVLDTSRNGLWAIVNPMGDVSEQIRYWCQKTR